MTIYPLYRKQITTLLENRPDESVDPVNYLIQELFEKEIYKGEVKFKENKELKKSSGKFILKAFQ